MCRGQESRKGPIKKGVNRLKERGEGRVLEHIRYEGEKEDLGIKDSIRDEKTGSYQTGSRGKCPKSSIYKNARKKSATS